MTLYVSNAEVDMGLQIYALLTLGTISPGKAASHNSVTVTECPISQSASCQLSVFLN
jgi:hypothetical protein